MNPNIEGSLKGLSKVYNSLDSLANVEEDYYYYFYNDTGEFYKSGNGAVGLLDSYWGKGYFTSSIQSLCRVASGENHKKLSDGITAVADSIIEELRTIETIAFSPAMTPLKRQSLLEGVATLHAKVQTAVCGIQKMESTYKSQPLKRRVFTALYQKYREELSTKIQALYKKMVSKNAQDKYDEEQRLWKRERTRRLTVEGKRRKRVGVKYQKQVKHAEIARTKAYLVREKNRLDPRTGLTEANVDDISRFLTVYQDRLHRLLEKQIQKDKENPFLYLRPANTGMPRIIQYWFDKVVIHLKDSKKSKEEALIGKGVYKTVTKSVEFKEGKLGKILANGCSTVKFPHKKNSHATYTDTVADNELNFLTKYRNLRGIVKVKRISRFRTKSGKIKQSILMKYYNLGNLLDHIKSNDLSRDRKNWIFLDILYGIIHIHKDNAINLDIKPDNILLENTSKMARKNGVSAALCDFGFCCYSKQVKAAGSHYYMAPEVVTAMYRPTSEFVRKIGPEADIWSLGCTFWLLYVGKYTPWMEMLKDQSKMSLEVLELMNKEDAIAEPEKETIEHLLWKMMRPKPEDRPTAIEALKQLKWLLQEVEVMQEIPIKVNS